MMKIDWDWSKKEYREEIVKYLNGGGELHHIDGWSSKVRPVSSIDIDGGVVFIGERNFQWLLKNNLIKWVRQDWSRKIYERNWEQA